MTRRTVDRATATWILAVIAASAAGVGAQQAPREPLAILVGRVADSTGAPISGARISVQPGSSRTTVTSDSGMFRFDSLAAGPNEFAVRRIGFDPITFSAALKPGKISRVKVVLSASTQGLPAMAISDTASHWLDAFDRRRDKHVGTFITRADFQKWEPKSSLDIVRGVPGVEISMVGGVSRVLFTRTVTRKCAPTMYIHGSPFSGQLDDLAVDEIEALEIYTGLSQIPPEFDRVGRNVCAVINIWTRDPRKPPGFP